MSDRFTDTASEAINAIATHGERINEALADRLAIFEQTFVGQGGAVAGRIGDQAERFTATLDDRLGAIESTLTLRGGDLNDRLALRAAKPRRRSRRRSTPSKRARRGGPAKSARRWAP